MKCILCEQEYSTDNILYCPECEKKIIIECGIDEPESRDDTEQGEEQAENYCRFCGNGGCVQCTPKNYL